MNSNICDGEGLKHKKIIFGKPEIIFNKWYITLFIFMQIHLTFEAAPKGLRWTKETIVFSSFILILILFLYNIIFNRLKINKSSLLFTICIISASLTSIIINHDFEPDNFIFISIVISGFCVCNIFSRRDYLEGYVRAMIIYSIYSIIATYILLPLIMKGAFNFFPTTTNILGTPFIDMGFSFVVKWKGVMRNQGIFREPGVYQFFILVALAIELFYIKCHPSKNIIIIILTTTLISTFSTAGFICSIPLFYLFIVQARNGNAFKAFLIFLIVIAILYYLIIYNESFSYLLLHSFNKLSEGKENGSFIVRFESIFNLLRMSMHNPIFGSSFTKGFHYIQDYYNTFGTNDITGTMFSYIMALGYPIGLWINYNFYRFCTVIKKNGLSSILIFISFFVSVNTQNLVYNTLIWTFIFMPYMKESNRSEVSIT